MRPAETFWTGKQVLVTGGASFIGSTLTDQLLARGARVRVVDDLTSGHLDNLKEPMAKGLVEFVKADLREPGVARAAMNGVDTVFHLAAQTTVGTATRNPTQTFETNIQGTWNLLEACRRSSVTKQIVIASSDKAYGSNETLPYREAATPLQGRHPYDVSKSCADLIAQTYAATYRLPVAITRCGNLFGGGDLNWNRIVPGTIRSVLRGRPPVIRSDGQYVRDYFYVEDGVAAYILLAERLAANRGLAEEAFNFSYGVQITVLELVRQILQLMGSDLEPEVRDFYQIEKMWSRPQGRHVS